MPFAQLSEAELQRTATAIRRSIITMLAHAQSGHPAGALGMTDVVTTLYYTVLNHKPEEPTWSERDFVVLSNGHICPVLYAVLARTGYFPQTELMSLRKMHSRLQGHPHKGSLPGIENTSGPLGQGLSQAAGLALAHKMDGKPNRVFCLMSDGEHQEGQTWEAYLFAAKNKLRNITVLVDRNYIQIDGYTEEIMPLDPLKEKIQSFGWEVREVDGHSFTQITQALTEQHSEKPTAIICHTTPGKGVSFMENKPEWHGKPPTHAEAEQALKELGL